MNRVHVNDLSMGQVRAIVSYCEQITNPQPWWMAYKAIVIQCIVRTDTNMLGGTGQYWCNFIAIIAIMTLG